MAEASLYTKAEQEEKIVRMIIENSKHARYAAIWDLNGKVLSKKHAKGEENILTLEETQTTIKRSLERWKERDEFADKIGKGEYSVVSYEKIKRFHQKDLPCNNPNVQDQALQQTPHSQNPSFFELNHVGQNLSDTCIFLYLLIMRIPF